MSVEDEKSAYPFAQLIQDYMWSRRPPLNPHKFAGMLGIGRQTVYNWLTGTKPQANMLPVVADKTGLSLTTLYTAAGYDLPWELAVADIRIETLLGEVLVRVNWKEGVTAEYKQSFLTNLREQLRQATQRWSAE